MKSPIKWVGGKGRLTKHILQRLPDFKNYWEPCFGGGAVFFSLPKCKEKTYHLSDINSDLINLWKEIQNNWSSVKSFIIDIKSKYELSEDKRSFYYELRNSFNKRELGTYHAALFAVINKICFNGLLRYNSKLEFNAAWGKYDKVNIDFGLFEEVHRVFNEYDVRINLADIRTILPEEDDFVFIDPPYHTPTKRSIDSKTYNWDNFDNSEQKNIDFVKSLPCKFMFFNHDCEFIRDNFSGFNFETVSLSKVFSGKAESRIKTAEIIVTNF